MLEVVLRGLEVVLRGIEVVLRGMEVVLRGMEVVLRGTQVISPARGLALHLHDHHFQHSALLFFGAF